MTHHLRRALRDRRFPPPGLKLTADDFAGALAGNERHMPEHAAMAATCDQLGISEEEGYDFLISLNQEPRP